MKIGFVTTSYPRYNGDAAGSFIAEQVMALRSLGHDVKVIAPEFDGEDFGDAIRIRFKPRLARNLAYGNGIWPNLKKNPLLLLAIPGFMKSFEKTIREEFADREVIEAVFTAAGKAVANARRPGQAIVYAGHGSDIHLLERSTIYRRQFGQMINSFDGVAVVSQYLAKKITSFFPNINPIVIPNGVSDEIFTFGETWLSTPTAIYSSRFIPLKRIDMLVSAWAKVVKEIPHAKLLLFGDGPLVLKCKEIVEKKRIENNVVFKGRVPQNKLWIEMGNAWLTLLVSKEEGFGIGLLESLACGCPFIAAPCGAAPEIAERTGGGIIINEPLNIEKLAETIISAFSNKNILKKMGELGKKKVYENYLWRDAAKMRLDYYRKTIK
ncbi:glycosyltransferase [Desulfogranum japonicum]|uniref:glycosyltransferase n=1 Tax=Desulfogranum japonicum TaxID=231447 RepID=UPI0004296008|nr:glycosyltransferase [Desulfogranum japonicum]